MSKRVLAFDLGASSGRAMLGNYSDGHLTLTEIHRFPNDPVKVRGTLYWDILRLYHEIKQGITKAAAAGGFDSLAIDTWGVDFGLLDREGRLLENPVHYRDERTKKVSEEVFRLLPKEKLYRLTGIQYMHFNTLYQLYYLKQYRPDLLKRADTALLIPDLLAYFLTGQKRCEVTNASTTNLLDPKSKSFAKDVFATLALPELFPAMIRPGESYGMLSDDLCQELGCPQVPVLAAATHDTASAVASVPAAAKDFIYISSGTWSLFGTESGTPNTGAEAMKANFTNETGYQNTTRLLKNIMGLWLILESRRQCQRVGETVGFDTL